MRDSDTEHTIALIILAIAIFFAGFIAGVYHLKAVAIDNGVAKYEIKDNLGNTEFKWIKPL